MLLQYFPQFPRLPVEIRSCIWRSALRQPRLHRLRITTTSPDEPFLLQPTETLSRSTVTYRTILATCQESRAEALRALPNALPLGHSFLRFNAQEDVICLVQLSLSMLDAANTAATRFLAQEYSGKRSVTPTGLEGILQGFMQVKSLALEVRSTSFDTSLGFPLSRGLDHLARFISLFAKLGWLFLVSLPSPDDMETVACWDMRTAKETHKHGDGYDESDDNEDYTDDETGDEHGIGRNDAGVSLRMPGGGVRAICGNWIRGENGLRDWYRWVPRLTNWAFTNDNVEVHFSEMFVCKNTIQDAFRGDDWVDLSVDARRLLRSVRVRVMIHFREGVEPLYEV